MPLRILATKPNPELVRLPWHLPLEEWGDDVVLPLPRGISRHVVRIVRVGGHACAVKETQEPIARREYELLRDLRKLDLPTVVPQAVVTGRQTRDGEELPSALVTRHLRFSLPYRSLFSHGLSADSLPSIVDALVVLLVRLHLAGFFWGDVSLSNVLFRRSAGEFAAYLVDAETGELRPQLSDGQRRHDLTRGHRERLRRAPRPPGRRVRRRGVRPHRGHRDAERPLRRPVERAHPARDVQRRGHRDVEDRASGWSPSTTSASTSTRWTSSPRARGSGSASSRAWSRPATTGASCGR